MADMLTPSQYYEALCTRDARFDGRFLVAVKTTGIYCRPICRVRTPLARNCTYYRHAAAAEAAGYRPCRRCRPELAPGHSLMEASSNLARSAAQFIGADFLADHSLADLAGRLGVTDRQVRRAFREEFGVSPVEFWQTQRLLLAKQLLTDSKMPVTMVAFASGFRSLRRFNALLKERYRLTPTDLRKAQRPGATREFPEFPFRLAYRPPLDWERMLGFIGARAVPGVEAVADGSYCRTVRIRRQGKDLIGHVRVAHDGDHHVLTVRISEGLLAASAVVLERTRRLFDLWADPAAIDAALSSLPGAHAGLRVPGSFDPFELAVRAVLGQQVSVAAARTLAARLTERLGERLTSPAPGLTHLFPTPERIAGAGADPIASLGVTCRRAETLVALAAAVSAGKLVLDPGLPIEGTLNDLRGIPGIGEWTAQYIAMRALAWPDAFPHADLGLAAALGERDPKKVLALAEPWRPWRAYAVVHLWTRTPLHAPPAAAHKGETDHGRTRRSVALSRATT